MSAQILGFPLAPRTAQASEEVELARAARKVAIEFWTRHCFRRDREIDGSVPKTPRQSFPNLEKILSALLMLVVEEVEFSAEEYGTLCKTLFEWLMRRSPHFRDASGANTAWALKIIEDRDVDALALRVLSLQKNPSFMLVCKAERSRLLTAFGVPGDAPEQWRTGREWLMIIQSFQLVFVTVVAPDDFKDMPVPSHEQEARGPVRGRPNLRVAKEE